jgi:type III pantothenate kinase
MIALVDVGNTRTKYCISNYGRRSTIASFANEQLSNEFLDSTFSKTDKLIIACVSHNELADKIKLWCYQNNIGYQQVVSEKSKNGVISAYHTPKQLGVDRWLTLIAASSLHPRKNILIVDAGTATTIDLLASNGKHQGGWILAGIDTLFSCVLENTSQVQASAGKSASLTFGFNSSDNVNNATWAATVGAINLAIAEGERQGIAVDEVLLTGGNGLTLSSLLLCECTVIEDLVFIGLQAYI